MKATGRPDFRAPRGAIGSEAYRAGSSLVHFSCGSTACVIIESYASMPTAATTIQAMSQNQLSSIAAQMAP